MFAEVSATSVSATTSDGYHGLGFAADVAAAAVTPTTAGIERTLGSGGRFFVYSLQLSTADTTRGKILLNAGTTSPLFAVGYWIAPESTVSARQPFFGPAWAKTRLVAR